MSDTQVNRDTPKLRPWLIASMVVGVLSLVFNPLVQYEWLPQSLDMAMHVWSHGFDEILGLLFVIVWIVLCVMAVVRLGRRGLWLLVGAPVVLPPAYVIVGFYVSCKFYNACL